MTINKPALLKAIGESQEVLEAIKTISTKAFDPDSCLGKLSEVGCSLTELKRETIALEVRLSTMLRIATRVASSWKD